MTWWRALLGLPEAASTYADRIDLLHAIIIATTMAGAAVVAVVACIFTVRFRQRRTDEGATTPLVAAPRMVEWGVISGLTALFVAWWWFGYRQFLGLQQPPARAVDVFVTAKQWMWEFAYGDGRSSIAVLVVPAGQPIRLVMISRDVIHSFFVPDFRLKHDVLPGRTSVAWFEADQPGIHQLLCAEYCGLDHSRMRGQIVVLAPADFARWRMGEIPVPVATALALAQGDQSQAAVPSGAAAVDLPAAGLAAAARHGCMACHTSDGQSHVGPTWRGLFGRTVVLADGRRIVADEAYLTESMMDPTAKVVAGYPPVMPSYQGLLEPQDAAALVAFIKSLRLDTTPPQELPRLPQVRSEPP